MKQSDSQSMHHEEVLAFYYDRIMELADQVECCRFEFDKRQFLRDCLIFSERPEFALHKLPSSRLRALCEIGVLTRDEEHEVMMSYLRRKQLARKEETIISVPYIEISDKIRKVTYNTDFFERTLFERR